MEELLIEKVREHESLYNIECRNYKNKQIRQESWEEIGRDLNISATDAKETWDELRKCYANALSRRRATKSGQAAKKILPFLENRKTYTNLEQFEKSEDILQEVSEPDLFENSQENGNRSDTSDHEVEAEVSQNKQPGCSRQTASLVQEPTNRLDQLRKQKNVSQTRSPAQQMVEIIKKNSDLRQQKYKKVENNMFLPGISKTFSDLDESDFFYLSMSRTTKTLLHLEQAKLKLQISNLVLQAEIDHAHQNTTMGTDNFTTNNNNPTSNNNYA
ncbi:uncharacterized protein LOC126737039 [Anthonomus grandis grandis]|uniref:uncharacterized protein LOC126737039 n=1 Tax=Anthonomus grandis grandis TaxID=2921223 RepID=UPI002165685C|nr:uncharacterized protein LOC126737039 [Anthonomus grandis grandis]